MNDMRKILTFAIAALTVMGAYAQSPVSGPDGRLKVSVSSDARYSVEYDGITVLEPSSLGLNTNIGDYSSLKFAGESFSKIDQTYSVPTIKTSKVNYKANVGVYTFQNPRGNKVDVEFRVSDNDIAFRYILPREGEAGGVRIFQESTSFKLPQGSVSYLTPQSDAMIGFARTKPSYEEFYYVEKPLSDKS